MVVVATDKVKVFDIPTTLKEIYHMADIREVRECVIVCVIVIREVSECVIVIREVRDVIIIREVRECVMSSGR